MTLCAESRPASLARNTVWNIAGQTIPLAAAMAAIPYVVHGLGPERFGILAVAWLLLGNFALLDFGLGRAATKFIAEGLARRQLGKLPALVWTSLGLQIAMGCFAGLLLARLAPVLTGVFHIPSGLANEARRVFVLLALSLPLVLATNGLRAVLEAAQRFDLVNLLRVPASLSVYLLPAAGVWMRLSLAQIVTLLLVARLGVTIAHAVCCTRLWPELRRRPAWSRDALGLLLRYGGWVTLSNFANPILLYVDRFFIGSLLSISLLGLYTVPFEAVTKLWVIPASLAASLFPAFSGLAVVEERDRDRLTLLYARSFKYLLLLLGPVVLVLTLFAPELLTLWMGAQFARQTATVLRLLACGVFVNCFAHIPFGLLQSRGRPDLAATVLLIELPVYLPFAWYLVRRWGIPGAATGWTVRVALETMALAMLTGREFTMSARSLIEHGALKSLFGIATLGIALTAAKLLFHGFIFGKFAAVIALSVIYCALVWHKILDRTDRGQVQGMLLPLLRPAKG
jgi:O-antigen/teichoic acid export membrane protein